ncbi:MAG TPA: cysteine desulfurase-like protein [Steroidobacteraceae bacterium]|nr:cysteine desulfurase-like protein [Steroidobacteraceae bacterium]
MPFTASDCARCRTDFPALRQTHAGLPLAFLDGPGGSQVPDAVIRAIETFYATCNVNTGGNYSPSREVDRRLWQARRSVAAFLGAAGPESISFGQNMTSLCYALAHAIGRTLEPGDEIAITELDHEANRSPWLMLRERGAVVRELRLLDTGELDPADMAAKINARTKVLAIGASSNALGTINDLDRARRLSAEVGALLVVDAVHFAPHRSIDMRALGADFLLCSAYKFYGPHVGILCSRPGALERLPTDRLSAQDSSAPYRIETGTLNHAAIEGVRAAIDYIAGFGQGADLRARIVDAMSGIAEYEHGLAAYYHQRVGTLPGVRIYGPPFGVGERAPTVSLTLRGHHPAAVASALGERGICVWDGAFYAVRTVEVLGLTAGGGLLRTGISLYNTREEVDRLLSGIEAIAR